MKLIGLGAVTAAALLITMPVSAQVVAEWRFDDDVEKGLDDTIALSTAAEGAATTSVLRRSGGSATASYHPESTGIDTATWAEFLGNGFLQVSGGSYNTSAGLVTEGQEGQYRRYMRFRGFGEGEHTEGDVAGKTRGGTVYLIIQPSDEWSAKQQRGLFGSGYNIGRPTSGGAISLYQQAGTLTIQISRGETAQPGHNENIDLNGDGDYLDTAVVETTIDFADWDSSKWYFVAASWTTGEAPILYLRELDPDAQPLIGQPKPANITATEGERDRIVLEATPVGREPYAQVLAIGSTWYDAGDGGGPAYGMAGKLAYARIDNVFSSIEDIEAVFNSLKAGSGD